MRIARETRCTADLLFDSRRSTTSNEPRWLVSGVATCGLCNYCTTMRVTGSCFPSRVRCASKGHLRRTPTRWDELVAARGGRPLERVGEPVEAGSPG